MQIPTGFIDNMKSLLGDESVSALIEALSGDPVVSIRRNPSKSISDGKIPGIEDGEKVLWSLNGSYLPQRPLFSLNPLLHAGAFYVQDASSMVFEKIADIALKVIGSEGRPVYVLDLCAAPGGKSTAVAARLPEGSVLCANEFIPQRCSVLKENIIKWGYPDAIVSNSSTDRFASLGLFDIVIVDAPCSGEGMMRKDSDAVAQWSKELIAQCAGLQRKILDDAVGALKPGGILIYSTCTFNSQENEDNVRYIAEKYSLTPIDTELTGIGGILPGFDSEYPALRFMPHSTRGEGLFVSVLQKPMDSVVAAHQYAVSDNYGLDIVKVRRGSKSKSSKGKEKGSGKDPGRNGIAGKNGNVSVLMKFLKSPDDYILSERGDEVWAVRPQAEVILKEFAEAGIKVVSAGIPLGVLKGNEYTPHPFLPLSTGYNPASLPDVVLNEGEALSFLRKEGLTFSSDIPKGYVTVSYAGIHLGLMKNIGSRANNLWPTPWKLRI